MKWETGGIIEWSLVVHHEQGLLFYTPNQVHSKEAAFCKQPPKKVVIRRGPLVPQRNVRFNCAALLAAMLGACGHGISWLHTLAYSSLSGYPSFQIVFHRDSSLLTKERNKHRSNCEPLHQYSPLTEKDLSLGRRESAVVKDLPHLKRESRVRRHPESSYIGYLRPIGTVRGNNWLMMLESLSAFADCTRASKPDRGEMA